jgi:hypothetical protein
MDLVEQNLNQPWRREGLSFVLVYIHIYIYMHPRARFIWARFKRSRAWRE